MTSTSGPGARALSIAARYAFGIALVWWLVRTEVLDFRPLATMSAAFMIQGAALGVAVTAFSSWRIRLLLADQGIEVGYRRCFTVNAIGLFYSLFLPCGVSGDAARAYYRIRHALEEDRMILFCQPILDLGGGEICQYELLLRLPDEEHGPPLPPSAFLYSAERSGLIQAIDAWVVRKAIGLIAEHARNGLELALNVNLSGKSIGDLKLAMLIEDALAETGIDPARLTLELTETAAISNIEDAKAFALRLHGRGCRLALDDFGAGFGSFYYLKSFPFDYLKIAAT